MAYFNLGDDTVADRAARFPEWRKWLHQNGPVLILIAQDRHFLTATGDAHGVRRRHDRRQPRRRARRLRPRPLPAALQLGHGLGRRGLRADEPRVHGTGRDRELRRDGLSLVGDPRRHARKPELARQQQPAVDELARGRERESPVASQSPIVRSSQPGRAPRGREPQRRRRSARRRRAGDRRPRRAAPAPRAAGPKTAQSCSSTGIGRRRTAPAARRAARPAAARRHRPSRRPDTTAAGRKSGERATAANSSRAHSATPRRAASTLPSSHSSEASIASHTGRCG